MIRYLTLSLTALFLGLALALVVTAPTAPPAHAAMQDAAPVAVNTATRTPTKTRTPTPGPTQTRTPTNTPTVTNTPTETPTATNTPTRTPTPTVTPTHTPTNTPTATPTSTPTSTPLPTGVAPYIFVVAQNVVLTAQTPLVVWTPVAGKNIRLVGAIILNDSSAVTATLALSDTASTFGFARLGTNGTQTYPIGPGGRFLSNGQPLGLKSVTGGTFDYTLWGYLEP